MSSNHQNNMPVESLILSIFNLFMDKAGDETLDNLQNGDVANERFHDVFKQDLHDIKTKLDNHSKIDLCSSLDYLEEGFLQLFKCFDEVEGNVACEEESNTDKSHTTCGAITTRYELSSVIQNSSLFESAKNRFKDARKEATRAFNNENLSLEDRIFATAVKVMAQIFECPELPENAVDLCLTYIKRLHQLDGVSEMFSVFIDGGLKAMFKKSQRKDNIQSVILLNHHLYQFIVKIKNNHDHSSNWPGIILEEEKMFNPLLDWRNKFTLESWSKKLFKPSKEIEKIESTMFRILEKLTVNEHFAPSLKSPVDLVMDLIRDDILVAGGYPVFLGIVEIFSWRKKKWFKIATMQNEHSYASSFIFNDNLFVVGGYDCKSIETLNLNEPLTWKTFFGELVDECWSHQTVVYKEQILHIGGFNCDEGTSDLISETKISGSTSFVLKKMCHMPEPRRNHGAKVVDDKVLIIGGRGNDLKILSSVLEFNPITCTFKEMPQLPYPLYKMCAVSWRDQVVLLGGFNDVGEALNKVIMYDGKTGKCTVLPSMLEKRSECCAVITDDTIVVMGGENDKGEHLKSVECFEMGSSSSWTYLPSMNEPRQGAIAEVFSLNKSISV
ncbi:uncharacterized protein LOC124436680 [Xenia sp. Carnegie-2017]|uniref:uncharacterized protein LOC124436680 n=1 Tax=Xenia sp. Carnegie-2017 TaxID=2897299 RepID=UPI001F03C125|nr:uncharacterized protein LOC124436680 [Xenia sp. Carnegie-2017]